MSEWEYIFERNLLSDWQKKLNQWRHDYEFEIMETFYQDSEGPNIPMATILLKRKRKEQRGA